MYRRSVDRNVSISILRPKTKDLICSALNSQLLLPASHTDYLRDWRGLFTLCGIDLSLQDSVALHPNQTQRILELWYQANPEDSTLTKFLSFLEEMERFDVLDDIIEAVDEDIEAYRRNSEIALANPQADQIYLTIHDALNRNGNSKYDACMLYVNEDKDFAEKLRFKMEEHYNLKFCVPKKHLLSGQMLEMDAMIALIIERCNRVVVILSDNFFQSEINKFYLKLAQMFGIENKKRKIVPCLYRDCTLPYHIKYASMLDFRQKWFDVYEKLWLSLV